MFIFKAHQRRKGLNLCSLCIWTMRKALELDTPGPPFVCFKPTESKSIYGGCSRAWCPCSHGDLSRPRQRTERLNAQNRWNIASRPPASSGSMPQLSSRTLSFSRGQAECHQTIIWPSSPAALGHDGQLMRSVKDTEVFLLRHFYWLCPSQWCSSTTPKKVWEAELGNVTFKMSVIILC